MHAKMLTPILNVSDIQQAFAWFEKLGWKKAWDWGSPPDFGCICSGECNIFLCQEAQGGRGKGSSTATFGSIENAGGQGRLVVYHGRRRGSGPPALPGAGSRDHLAANRRAMGYPGNARAPSRWPRLQNRQGNRGRALSDKSVIGVVPKGVASRRKGFAELVNP